MKKYFMFAAAVIALTSCSNDDFLGGKGSGNEGSSNAAILFNGGTNNITRATQTGATAAQTLNNKFVVYGYKTSTGEPATAQTVYDHYNVEWNNKAGSTLSNTKGWEYVGIAANSLNNVTGAAQTIKYWDYSAAQYDFVAFSFGTATQGNGEDEVTASKVSTTPSYTLTGKVTNLIKCFISDRVTAKNGVTADQKKANKLVAYQDPVSFNFRSLATKVRIGIYEIIPGYSVKNVKFYTDDTTLPEDNNEPTLYAESKKLPNPEGKGTMTVTFGSNKSTDTDFNQAKVAWNKDATTEDVSTIAFKNLVLKEKEANETKGTQFIGRNATERSNTDYNTVLPVSAGKLTLKVDYTLESIDGSGEEIKVTGATAVVPETYTNWQPNYAYTYIFKISDKTNGSTGGSTEGLYPITFDAVVTETEDGLQETITAVESPSITTYAKGAVGNEYKATSNIYVSAQGETFSADNCALYTATATGNAKITEATVAKCLSGTADADNGWSMTDGTNGINVKKATGLSIVTEIDAADAADNNAIAGNFAKFTPATAGTYVFEYTKTTPTTEEGKQDQIDKFYKVIIVTSAE